jgi:dTDP-4-dehydrorhamnose 3,5-epimerase
MIFTETKLKDAYIIEIEPIEDERGFFARSFCQKEFERHGISINIAQCNISYNKTKGTLRGMHYQVAPHEEAKIVSCIRGSIYDIIIDLRPDSSTYCKWIAVELAAGSSEERAVSSKQSPLSSQASVLSPDSTAHRSPLTAQHRMLYIPKGLAHGFLTLADHTEVFYHMSEFYAPGFGRGVRWNDPTFRINWPGEVKIVSDQDRGYPDFICTLNR